MLSETKKKNIGSHKQVYVKYGEHISIATDIHIDAFKHFLCDYVKY